MTLRGVLFDVDFTLVKPGPDLGPEGYQALGRRFGLELDPSCYADARAAAVAAVERHPELDHDEEVWVLFTERIVRGMGGDSERAHECAVEMTHGWEHAENFELYEDTLPVLGALRAHGLKIGLVSNTGRDLAAFVAHHALDVDAAVGSGAHGKTKPHPAIFLSALGELGIRAEEAAMVGDSPEDDIAGARALGMQAFLVDREGRFPEAVGRLSDLWGLPAALGLAADSSGGGE
jgi:putative hydrolase of the HAD superfamily